MSLLPVTRLENSNKIIISQFGFISIQIRTQITILKLYVFHSVLYIHFALKFLLTSTLLCYIIKIQGAIGKRSARSRKIRNNRNHVQFGRLFLFAVMERHYYTYPCCNSNGQLNKISPCYVIIHYTSLLLQKSTE